MSNEPVKNDIAKHLLSRGTLFVHMDPRREHVVVPPWLRHQAQLVLQVGFHMPIPIPDLKVDEFGIRGTLSFAKTPFLCEMPWNSIFALVGDEGRGMVWPESMPAEIAAEVEREATVKASEPGAQKPPALKSVTGGRAGLEKRKTTRGTLRLV